MKTKKKCVFQRRPFFAHTKFANIWILSSKLLVNYYSFIFRTPISMKIGINWRRITAIQPYAESWKVLKYKQCWQLSHEDQLWKSSLNMNQSHGDISWSRIIQGFRLKQSHDESFNNRRNCKFRLNQIYACSSWSREMTKSISTTKHPEW